MYIAQTSTNKTCNDSENIARRLLKCYWFFHKLKNKREN